MIPPCRLRTTKARPTPVPNASVLCCRTHRVRLISSRTPLYVRNGRTNKETRLTRHSYVQDTTIVFGNAETNPLRSYSFCTGARVVYTPLDARGRTMTKKTRGRRINASFTGRLSANDVTVRRTTRPRNLTIRRAYD